MKVCLAVNGKTFAPFTQFVKKLIVLLRAPKTESKAHQCETVWSLVEMVALKKLIFHL